MKNIKSKTTATAIAIFLVSTITATLVALPAVNAHTPPWTVKVWCYVDVTNRIIGVNQQEVIVFWVNAIPPTAKGGYGDRWKFTIDVTKPDGTKETLGPFTSDPVGGSWTAYTPTQIGNYTVVAHMAAHVITGLPLYPGQTISQISGAETVNDTYGPADSDPVTFIVQQEPIQPWQETPLPTQFWTRPINEMNREWWQVAANWLAGAAHNWPPGSSGGVENYAYSSAPDSAHILWAKPLWYGGLMDARFGNLGYQTSHYDGISFSPPIIMNGRIYYNHYVQPKIGWHCVDLYTGEELYFHNTTGPVNYALRSDASGALLQEMLSFGQILSMETPNEHGGRPYLWSTYGPGMPTGRPSSGGQSWPNNNATWMMFDQWTGTWMLNIANVSTAGTNVYGKDGSILYYNIGTSMYGRANTGGVQRLTVWNSTKAIFEFSRDPGPYAMRNYEWCWRPWLNITIDGSRGFSTNVTISPAVTGSIRAIRESEYIIGGTAGSNNEQGITQGVMWCLGLKPGEEGKLLWNRTFTPPSSAGNLSMSAPSVDVDNGMFYFTETKTRTRWGYSLDTMQQVWKSEPESPWNFYGMGDFVYEDKYFGIGAGNAGGGQLIAYNATTGKILWIYTAQQEGFESPYGNYPISMSLVTADGKIFLSSSEHSPTQPLWRGSRIRCINASNGVELWTINNWGGPRAADGFLVAYNAYDGQMYCFGKGPSATTVTASPEVSVHGNSVLLKGTVADISPGTKQLAQAARFPNGVPAIADESMSAWMEYLYHQQAMPTNATGVEVTLDTIDPNGNFVHIGTATSDISGMFSYMFTPEVPGKYTIIATFAGSKSYWASYAETAIGVSEAPPTTAAPEYPQPIDYTLTIVSATVVLLIAIAIVGILLLRKRP